MSLLSHPYLVFKLLLALAGGVFVIGIAAIALLSLWAWITAPPKGG